MLGVLVFLQGTYTETPDSYAPSSELLEGPFSLKVVAYAKSDQSPLFTQVIRASLFEQ